MEGDGDGTVEPRHALSKSADLGVTMEEEENGGDNKEEEG